MQCVARRSMLYFVSYEGKQQEEELEGRLGALGIWSCPTAYVIVASSAPYASAVLPPWTT